jgi:glutathione S-transferase
LVGPKGVSMSNIRLYSARACPFAHRTRLILAEKQQDFELVEVDLANKPSWFGRVSLYGKVPALEHGAANIVESAVINEYLEEVFPEPRLLPERPAQRALVRFWVDYANTRFAPAFAKVLRGAGEAEREAGRRELGEALLFIEREALNKLSETGPYWFGSELSLADFAFYPWFERLPALQQHSGFTLPSPLNRVLRWHDALQARPSVRSIANSTDFYLARYRAYAPAPGVSSTTAPIQARPS